MRRLLSIYWVAPVVLLLISLALIAQASDVVDTPESSVGILCQNGKYHEAMRALPKIMAQWKKYTKNTGLTDEGKAGYLYATTLFTIASKGDADWGRILDDPDIPYTYKTEMIFEILELRLGKGAVYAGDQNNFIVPRARNIDLDKEMIKLPK
jgi:hypothetical protein